MRDKLNTVEKRVKLLLEEEGSGHDWLHIERVRNLAVYIGVKEGGHIEIIELASLLHDLSDEKMNIMGQSEITSWLSSIGFTRHETDQAIHIIETISFKGNGKTIPSTIEGKAVQDADRLDAIGAIGIARAFLYAGSKGHLLHLPKKNPRETLTDQEYRQNPSTAINHFYEKLLKLSSLMNTNTGKELAKERHEFMEFFLNQFYKEWEKPLC
ncbi:HD domain-containing protein [Metabacillus sp. RGM 3146]|uniref:HD domain-containing protein n=1 Tax=Metabacillus sp. RGM 3146 TaxID=3401092 RepID=UPI003B98F705